MENQDQLLHWEVSIVALTVSHKPHGNAFGIPVADSGTHVEFYVLI